MKKTTKLFTIIISLIIIGSSIDLIPASGASIGVSIDGRQVVFTKDSGQPFIDSASRTQVPLRATMEAAGCSVAWDSTNKIAVVEKNGVVVKVPIGRDYIIINGTNKSNDTKALIKDNRTYLPIRSVLEAFGAVVNWNAKSKVVEVSTSTPATVETLTYDDGSIYTGTLMNGVPDGNGTINFSNGNSYVGEWYNDYFHGYGTFTWSDGEKYVGNWSLGQREGFGTYTWNDGTSFAGMWRDGEPVVEISSPVNVRAMGISTSEINVGWDSVYGADYYHIYYASSPSGPWYTFNDNSGKVAPQDWIGQYSSTLFGLEPSTTVYFKVTAVKLGVESEYSNVVYATTQADKTIITTPTHTASSDVVGPLSLYSDETRREYLGKLTSNTFDADSIFNEYGLYGSKYGLNSIWNKYGTYGSEYSLYSAFNKYTSSPPIIVDGNGTIVGRLSVNTFVSGGINPYDIKSLLEYLGL